MVPGVEIANLHDSIPLGFFIYFLKNMPGLQDKPFPPEVQPDLNPTAPIELPEREAPDKTLPPAM
jgi:hypothetical protein